MRINKIRRYCITMIEHYDVSCHPHYDGRSHKVDCVLLVTHIYDEGKAQQTKYEVDFGQWSLAMPTEVMEKTESAIIAEWKARNKAREQ